MTTNTEIPATLSAAGSGKGSKGLLSRLKRDDKGIAAVEFAMIVPIMFFLFIGSIEFSRAITVDRRVTQAASSTADLVARVDRISSSEMGDVMNIVGALLAPYSQTPLTIELRSVHANASDATNTQARWKCTFSGGTTNCQSGLTESYTMPVGLLAAGESAIVAEAKYNYQPLVFGYFIKTAFDLNEKFYLKPRTKSCVSLDNINCATGNPF